MKKINPVCQKAYKVVALDKATGMRRSFISKYKGYGYNAELYAIDYELDKIVRPKVGKLFVFDNKQDAVDFANWHFLGKECELWEVQAYGAERCERVLCVDNLPQNIEALLKWWTNRAESNLIRVEGHAPTASLCCKSLRMVRKLDL